MQREELVLTLRPQIITDIERESLTIEQFQNTVLRPILKFQHDLLVMHFKNYLLNKKSPEHQPELNLFVQQSIQNDLNLRVFLIGLIVALFTLEELIFYHQNTSEINRRISQMIITRIQSAL